MRKATRFYCESCTLSDTVFWESEEDVSVVLERIAYRHKRLLNMLGHSCTADYFSLHLENLDLTPTQPNDTFDLPLNPDSKEGSHDIHR